MFVSCVCATGWKSSPEMSAALDPACPPPNGVTKGDMVAVAMDCQSTDKSRVIQDFHLVAKLNNGDVYVPLAVVGLTGSQATSIALPPFRSLLLLITLLDCSLSTIQ